MAHLYLTTDTFEAERIVEDALAKPTKHNYHDIDIALAKILQKELGFIPMCSIEVTGELSKKDLNAILKKAIGEGLFIAHRSNGNIEVYAPDNREDIIRLALQPSADINSHNSSRQYCLLRYSNNHNRIENFGIL